MSTKKKKTKIKKKDWEQVNTRVQRDLARQFEETVLPGMTKEHVFNAMVRLWVSLPKDARRILILDESSADETDNSKDSAFVAAVRKIVEDVLASNA